MSQDELSKLTELIKRRAELDDELTRYTRMVTVMFVDIVGSTRYFEKHGDVGGLVWVHRCMDMLSPVTERHGGTICKTIGDALMTYFEDPRAALQAAIEMQQMLTSYNSHQIEEEKIRVRIGLNYGSGVIKEKDVFGDVVNVAARIESLAKGEQIFISSELEEQIRSMKLPCRKIPEVSVKGKAKALDVFEVLWSDAQREAAQAPAKLPSPTVAARVPVDKAAQQPASTRGTVVMGVSPVAMAARPLLQFSLFVVRPDGSHGEEHRLERSVTVLGRAEGDIVLSDDSLISRRHARFTVTNDGLVVEDLKSANGIFWRLRKPVNLQDGDIILMGRQMFRFSIPKPEVPPSDKSGKEKEKAAKSEEKAAKPPAELVRLLAGGVEENHYPLQAGENLLGRTRGTLTFPEDAYLSSQHAKIVCAEGKWTAEDLNAANGTFVGVRDRVLLGDGDIVLIGHQLLRVTAIQS
jgi:class 3 adenylate cyclase/pSer/pThr/pTyr-binding forkhead associated (FHA) protein